MHFDQTLFEQTGFALTLVCKAIELKFRLMVFAGSNFDSPIKIEICRNNNFQMSLCSASFMVFNLFRMRLAVQLLLLIICVTSATAQVAANVLASAQAADF